MKQRRFSHTSVNLHAFVIQRGSTCVFSVKNPSSNTVALDIPIELEIIKCRYTNCVPPPQPGLELPATARPSTALSWSNDSHWSFTISGKMSCSHPATSRFHRSMAQDGNHWRIVMCSFLEILGWSSIIVYLVFGFYASRVF